MGKNIGPGGRAGGKILGRLAFYTWVISVMGLEDTGFREMGLEDTGFRKMGLEDTGTHSLRSRRGSTSRLGTLLASCVTK